MSFDLAPRDPAVDATAVVADLNALALHRFDQLQVLRALHAAQHDVIHREHVIAYERRDRAQLSVVDLAGHRVSARTELNRLALREARDVTICPTHSSLSGSRRPLIVTAASLLAPEEGFEQRETLAASFTTCVPRRSESFLWIPVGLAEEWQSVQRL